MIKPNNTLSGTFLTIKFYTFLHFRICHYCKIFLLESLAFKSASRSEATIIWQVSVEDPLTRLPLAFHRLRTRHDSDISVKRKLGALITLLAKVISQCNFSSAYDGFKPFSPGYAKAKRMVIISRLVQEYKLIKNFVNNSLIKCGFFVCRLLSNFLLKMLQIFVISGLPAK